MKVYITAPFRHWDNKSEIEYLCSLVAQSGFQDFCFIRDMENYQKIFDDAHELMRSAYEEIEKCDALLIDYDGPASGRMIELWIAYALGKKIILIHHASYTVKAVAEWVTDIVIPYNQIENIVQPMSELFNRWKLDEKKI